MEKKIKKIYIIGPMTGYPSWNYPAFDDAVKRGEELGYEMVSPAELNRVDGFDHLRSNSSISEEELHGFALRDIAALLDCDAIAALPRMDGK